MDMRTQPNWGTASVTFARKVMVAPPPPTVPAPHELLLLVAVTLPLVMVMYVPGLVKRMLPTLWFGFWMRTWKVTVEGDAAQPGTISCGSPASVNVHDAVS